MTKNGSDLYRYTQDLLGTQFLGTVVSGLIQDWVNSRIRIFEVGECRG